jgi:hypothetical protein
VCGETQHTSTSNITRSAALCAARRPVLIATVLVAAVTQPVLAACVSQPAGISCKYLFSPSFLVGSWRQASRHIETGCCISQSRQYVRSRRCCRFDRRCCFGFIAGVPLGVTARRVALRLRRSALSRSRMRKVRALVCGGVALAAAVPCVSIAFRQALEPRGSAALHASNAGCCQFARCRPSGGVWPRGAWPSSRVTS